ncbi:DUF3667 domain-containing protein [Flavilitoribacter nigricans]|nr:DUF3667 domain-containing protein [Flavilitoribacter nigricans]
MSTTTPERITLGKLRKDLLEQFNLERGLGYTIKQFLLRPRRAVEEYLYENRSPYIKPLSFLLLTTAVATFLMVQFVISKNQPDINSVQPKEWQQIPDLFKPGLKLLITGIQKYFNLYYLSNLPGVALGCYFIFRKKFDYNLAEYFVINTYIFSIQGIIFLLNIPIFANDLNVPIGSMLSVAYFVYAYQQIFRQNFWRTLLYCLIVYMIAQVFNLFWAGLFILWGIFFG